MALTDEQLAEFRRWAAVMGTPCNGSVFPHAATGLLLLAELDRLRALAGGLAGRVAAQSEILSKRAEAPACVKPWWELVV